MNLLKQNSGFTLIEMLVAIAIFVILSIMVLVNFRGDSSARALSDSTLLFSQGLRQMQNFALTCKEINAATYTSYGAYVSTGSSVILFANKNLDTSYNAGVDLIIETVPLKVKTTVDNVSNSIAFKCPNSEICFNNICGGNSKKTFVFTYEGGGSRSVVLDMGTGKIETQ